MSHGCVAFPLGRLTREDQLLCLVNSDGDRKHPIPPARRLQGRVQSRVALLHVTAGYRGHSPLPVVKTVLSTVRNKQHLEANILLVCTAGFQGLRGQVEWMACVLTFKSLPFSTFVRMDFG